MTEPVFHLDCTLRDGGYYNSWDFPQAVIADYLVAMEAAQVDYIELGLRSFDREGFKGATAYTTDDFIRSLSLPTGPKIGVMLNASELVAHASGPVKAAKLLCAPKAQSPVSLVRIASALGDLEAALAVGAWLKSQGYQVGINLMQIADRSDAEIETLAKLATKTPPDVLYFADSLGSLTPEHTAHIVQLLRRGWSGPLGIHTHDNMGYALANSLRAIDEGASWIDSTVTGMGRGPGNAKTEYLAIELDARRSKKSNLTPLLRLIRQYFGPLQTKYGWGSNVYYYLAGRHGIHPTYIQRMLADSRYSDADMLSVIEHLKSVGGKKFSFDTLEAGRAFFREERQGSWSPRSVLAGREVLILATGPGTAAYRSAIETYIRTKKPYVIALNTNRDIDAGLIDLRAACHPVRLLADCDHYTALPQPLACPFAMLPADVQAGLGAKQVHDFGIHITPGHFEFGDTSCSTPTGLVIAYALAIAASGSAAHVSIAGLDGYGADDPRNTEMDALLASYMATEGACPIQAITPSRYRLPKTSVYQLAG